jgi:hypothetical protein
MGAVGSDERTHGVADQEHVYVIGSPGSSIVKIGRTTNLANRLAAIQRMSPVPLKVLWTHPGGNELESNLHRYFASRRSHGEWFDFRAGDPVGSVRTAVETRAWMGLPRKKADRTSFGEADSIIVCGACGHDARSHTSMAMITCNTLFGDSDCGCICPRFAPIRGNRDELADHEQNADWAEGRACLGLDDFPDARAYLNSLSGLMSHVPSTAHSRASNRQ